MSTSIQKAAARLLEQIGAPRGAVNTFVRPDSEGPVIVVLVDPLYSHAIAGVPDTFEDYRVFLETRTPTVAFH